MTKKTQIVVVGGGAGFPVRDIRVQQHHLVPPPSAGSANEAEVWAAHPSRSDVHGMADCPSCGRPAPAGEMGHWGHCSFCRRETLAAQSPRPGTGDGPQGAPLSGADSVGAHP